MYRNTSPDVNSYRESRNLGSHILLFLFSLSASLHVHGSGQNLFGFGPKIVSHNVYFSSAGFSSSSSQLSGFFFGSGLFLKVKNFLFLFISSNSIHLDSQPLQTRSTLGGARNPQLPLPYSTDFFFQNQKDRAFTLAPILAGLLSNIEGL